MKTIWKVLIPVGAVGILGIILFPVFAVAHSGHGYSCAGNIHQLDRALLMYDEEEGVMPEANSWMDRIGKFILKEPTFHCPAVLRENRFAYGYATETQLGGKDLNLLKKPEEEPIVFDSFPVGRNAHTRRAIIQGFSRHPGQNIGYADGHVRFVKSRQP